MTYIALTKCSRNWCVGCGQWNEEAYCRNCGERMPWIQIGYSLQ